MAAAGRSVSRDHGVNQNLGHLASSTDSFKEDIQAIGRAVERLREGIAAGGGGSSDTSPRPRQQVQPDHDYLSSGRALSSSTLASETGFSLLSEPQVYAGVAPPLRKWSAGQQRDGSFVGGPLREQSTALRTSQSQGKLSLDELRSESVLAIRPSTSTGEGKERGDRDSIAVGPRPNGDRSPIHSLRNQTTGAGAPVIPWSFDINKLGDQQDRSTEPLAGDGIELHGQAAPSVSKQSIDSLPQSWPKSIHHAEVNHRRGESFEGGNGGGSDVASSSSSSLKSRSRGDVKRGAGVQEGGGGGKDEAETGSLSELRNALRAREDELLRLKRDVAAAASTSGRSRRLASSVTGGDSQKGVPVAAAVATVEVESSVGKLTDVSLGRRLDTNADSRPTTFSVRSSLSNDTSRFTAAEDREGRSVFNGGGGGGDQQKPAEVSQSTADREADLTRDSTALLVPVKRPGDAADPKGGATSTPLEQRLLLLPPPPQAFPLSGRHAPSIGSPLVASAYEGLRQMRMMLEEREREAGKTKEDSEKLSNRLSDLSARLRRSERKCKTQASQLSEAQADLRAARTDADTSRACLASSKKETVKAKTEARERAAVMRELDDEVVHLRERLQIATVELQKEKTSAAAVQSRLEASEREVREARDRARTAEDEREAAERTAAAAAAEAEAASVRGRKLNAKMAAEEVAELRGLVDEAREAAETARAEGKVTAAELRRVEEEGRRQAQEAAQTREQLHAERDALARVSLELEATVRERTQAVEKLSASEAETGRLHLELAAARTAAADKQKIISEHPEVAETLRAAEAELGELKASLAVARQGLERERQRVDQETRRAESLCKELQASETRRKAQEDDISLARNQVAKLAAQIEKEKNETRTEIVAAARQDIAAATEREGTLRATLDKAESDLQASRQREREALDKVVDLKTELAVGRNGLEQTETALAGALERARVAEVTARSLAQKRDSVAREQLAEVAEAARQDKETLKRELVAAQTHAAGVRAENGRLAAELERVSATRSNSAAAAVAAAGGGGGSGDGNGLADVSTAVVAAAAEAAVAEAAEAAAKSAVATALEMRTELENRLVLAQAEATEARTEVQRLKSDLNTETAARRRREVSGGAAMTGDEGDGPGGNSGWASQALREACAMMDRVSSALVDAVDDPGFGSPGGRGENALDDPRWAPPMLAPAQERNRGRIAASKRDRTVRIHRRRRALSVDSLGEGGGEAWFSLGKNATDVEAWRDGESSSRDMGRVCSERLRFSAARLLAVRREECLAADGRLARLREDLRDSEAREAETAARLEESRELSREQTGFVEGVWQERRRLEGELGARREEVERLRASEDAARMAATVLESRVEELSAALRKGVDRAKRGDLRDGSRGADAELAAAASPAAAAAGNEAREAVEAIRRQLDDLRREVDRTKRDQVLSEQQQNDQLPSDQSARSSLPDLVGHLHRRVRAPRSTGSLHHGAQSATSTPDAQVLGEEASREKPRCTGDDTRGQAQGITGARMTSVVLEGEFQRLRAKYEKAKGRIASLEEQVAATRRAGGLARKEFQGALEALKLSQALLLRIQRDRGLDGGGGLSREAQPLSTESHRTTATTVAESASAFPIAATMSAPPVQAKTDLPSSTQVHELTVQASRLRDMSRSVKSLLQLATGEVEGALEATSNSVEVPHTSSSSPFQGATVPTSASVVPTAAAAAGMVEAGSRREKATATTQTENGVWWGGREVLDKLKEELGMAKTTTEILQQENARLEQELDRATAQLGEVGEMLDSKTAQVVELEAQVNRAESDQRAANESVQSANNRVVEAENSQKALRESLESKDRELLNTTRRLDAAVGAEAELRGRCEELALASGAFAAEVARQKEESAKWQKHSRLAAENVSELRKRCAELVRMSDTCAKQRAQLEKELTSARAESQEVDADVAQVLDALASSEKERRRLEGKLEKQAKVAGDARRAARLAEGKSADVQRDVERERAALVEGAGAIEGVIQLSASRLKESLDSEIKRRMELERESKALASRVTDLEAALISASAEVRNGAKLAAERGAKHEKEVGKLNAEASRLRKELGVQSAKAREVEEREAEGRRKWAEEKAGIKEDAASAIERASHAAEAEVAKHEARRRQLLDNHERESDEAIRLRKEVEKITEVLKAETVRASAAGEALANETSLRARAVQDAAALRQNVEDLESALHKARTDANIAKEAARVSNRRVKQLQTEMRSAVTISTTPLSPPVLLEEAAFASRDGDSSSRWQQPQDRSRRGEGGRESSNVFGSLLRVGPRGRLDEDGYETFPALPADHVNGEEASDHSNRSMEFGNYTAGGSSSKNSVLAAGGTPLSPVDKSRHRPVERNTHSAAAGIEAATATTNRRSGDGGAVNGGREMASPIAPGWPAGEGGPVPGPGNGGSSRGSSLSSFYSKKSQRRRLSPQRDGGNEGLVPTSTRAVLSTTGTGRRRRRDDNNHGDHHLLSAAGTDSSTWNVRTAVERESTLSSPVSSRDPSESLSCSSSPHRIKEPFTAGAGVGSAGGDTRNLPRSSSGTIPRGGGVGGSDGSRGGAKNGSRKLLVRTGSVVVRDWKVGQQEAFSELDRKAASSLPFGHHHDGTGWVRSSPGYQGSDR